MRFKKGKSVYKLPKGISHIYQVSIKNKGVHYAIEITDDKGILLKFLNQERPISCFYNSDKNDLVFFPAPKKAYFFEVHAMQRIVL